MLSNELKNPHIINKASKGAERCSSGFKALQHCEYFTVTCLPMYFSHPLQNRVPRVQVLLPLPVKTVQSYSIEPFFVFFIWHLTSFYRILIRRMCVGFIFAANCFQSFQLLHFDFTFYIDYDVNCNYLVFHQNFSVIWKVVKLPYLIVYCLSYSEDG